MDAARHEDGSGSGNGTGTGTGIGNNDGVGDGDGGGPVHLARVPGPTRSENSRT